MNPESIDRHFPPEQQSRYINQLLGRVGLTRRRAQCLVRLWIYLLLKQHQATRQPLPAHPSHLAVPQGFIPCTHREAATLFYGDQDRGSDRAAGLMLDKLVALGLISKQFDGNTTCIQIRNLPEFQAEPQTTEQPTTTIDTFNPRTDTIPVANFLARTYNWLNRNTDCASHQIAKTLRRWSQQYPMGMRVLRRCDTLHPVGFYVLYPTAAVSEERFFMAPSKSLHLSTADDTDPIEVAQPGDPTCTSVFVRSWMIEPSFMTPDQVVCMLEDAQTLLQAMQQQFANLCDIHTLVVHPFHEELTLSLGFHKTGQDPQMPVYWMYMALDRYLELNIKAIANKLKLSYVTNVQDLAFTGQK